LQLMASFKDTCTFAGEEKHFGGFTKVDATVRNVVLKRRWKSYVELPDLPPEIQLIYAVRHPFDTLTSYHPNFPHRKFYVSEKRWRGIVRVNWLEPSRGHP
jgi:hypothetical protein